MSNNGTLCVVLLAVLVPGPAAAAKDSVTRYRLAADPGNSSRCEELGPALGRLHTVTVDNGDVEITSAGGIEGRMRELRPDVYFESFELSGLGLDVIADFSSTPGTLTVSDRLFGCKWRATPER